ncbi:hypothetical protein Tco_1311750 [Tanacetum coccineum]
MLLAMKDEAESNLQDEENDFMLDNSYGDETLEELTTAVIMMARIQPADENDESEPSYDAKAVSEVNASNKVHEQVNHLKRKTIIHTFDDDQIDSNIIFDDSYVGNNDGTSEHDFYAHDEYHDIQMLAYNLQRETENKKRLNNELKKQKELLQKELETFKDQETLEDAEESQLKMRNKSVQLNYGKLNALYETFVPQQETSAEQTYFSIPSTSNIYSEKKEVTSDLLVPKMPKETTWTQHQKELDELIEHVNQKTYAYADVRAQNQDLLMTIFELKNKLKTIEKGKNADTKFDKSETSITLLCVTPLPKTIAVKAKKVSNTKVNADRSKPVTSHSIPKNKQSQKQSANVIARGMYRITKIETQMPNSKTNMNVSNSTGVESCNSVRRPKSKDTKSKDRVLKNTNDKRPSAHVQKMSSSVSIDSNKRETMHSNVCQSNASVLNTKTVNAVNDGSNIVYVSCGKDVFLFLMKNVLLVMLCLEILR